MKFLLLILCLVISCANNKPPSNSSGGGSNNQPYIITHKNIPKEVLDLANIGLANYKKEPLKSQRSVAFNAHKTGGGRTGDWIKATLGKTENDVITQLKTIDAPTTLTIAEINAEYNKALIKAPKNNTLALHEFVMVKGMGINYLHDVSLGKNAIVQLASQFNYLESASTNKVPVSAYLGDHTQGPQGSIEALAASLHRYASEDAGKLTNALVNILPENHSSYYKNGYLEVFNNTDQKALFEHFQTNIDKLKILPQWAICEASGAIQLQVFSAAPSYQAHSAPTSGSYGEKICDLLVSSQYEAIAKLAVIKRVETNELVNVHLTLVGQGAFNNPASVMKTSLQKVADVVHGHDKVRIYIHAFDKNDAAKVIAQKDDAKFSLKQMNKNEFMGQ
jgi:hypothetical protein